VKQKVKELPIPAEPQLDRWGYIWFPGNYGAHSLEAYIKVPLIHCKPPNFQPHRILMLADYYGKTYYDIGNTTQAISPRSIPSIESLLQAYLISRRNFYSEPSPFNGLYKAFRDFAESYCNMAAALPLVSLLS
jgi:hypothetical protein